MTRFGYTLMTEQNGPKDLVRYAVSAEHRGFDFEVCSDHFSPWLASQGHAPHAWAVLGAVAQLSERVDLYTYVTCPTMRYHPAIVAQQAATVQILADGRFTLGLGSGENLNEHVNGKTCCGRPSRSSARCAAAVWSTGAATTPRWIPRGCGTSRMSLSASRWRWAGKRPSRNSPPSPITWSPSNLTRTSSVPGTPHCRAPASPGEVGSSGRYPSAGTRIEMPPSNAPTTNSVGSAEAGKSTPTCPHRPVLRVRHSSS